MCVIQCLMSSLYERIYATLLTIQSVGFREIRQHNSWLIPNLRSHISNIYKDSFIFSSQEFLGNKIRIFLNSRVALSYTFFDCFFWLYLKVCAIYRVLCFTGSSISDRYLDFVYRPGVFSMGLMTNSVANIIASYRYCLTSPKL